MSDKQRRLEQMLAAVQLRHGSRALRRGKDALSPAAIPHITTGSAALDALTGCRGVSLGALTLPRGRTTPGKLTVACKLLAHAQRGDHGQAAYPVALLDLGCSARVEIVFNGVVKARETW